MSHPERPEIDPLIFFFNWKKFSFHILIYAHTVGRWSTILSAELSWAGSMWEHSAGETCDQLKTKNMLWALRNASAQWHYQLKVRGMMLHSMMLWKTTSEPVTCTQESREKAVSFRLAKSPFGKWLKKPFFTLISQRLIDLMRTRLFYERNFIRQSASIRKKWSAMFFCDRDLRLVERKNYYCLSNNMKIQNFCFKFAQRNSNIWEICGCRT